MNWYEYIASFCAGVSLANAVPHSCTHFPDRFPLRSLTLREKGLSSPTVNVVWALVNLIAGSGLFRVGKVSSGDNLAPIIFFGRHRSHQHPDEACNLQKKEPR